MAQAIKYFSGGGSFSNTPVTVYTCPANTIAKLQLVVKVGSSNTTIVDHYILYDSASVVSSGDFNIKFRCRNGDNANTYFYNTGSGYKVGNVSVVQFYPKSGVSTSTAQGLYNAADGTVMIDDIYMAAGNKLQFVSDDLSANYRHVYTALIIEEPAG